MLQYCVQRLEIQVEFLYCFSETEFILFWKKKKKTLRLCFQGLRQTGGGSPIFWRINYSKSTDSNVNSLKGTFTATSRLLLTKQLGTVVQPSWLKINHHRRLGEKEQYVSNLAIIACRSFLQGHCLPLILLNVWSDF